jgi:UDP-N-acetylglucosamine--N-acetylmuramyl-(pentapeptide) pyrophosphoryl-undecaprenol N-acetylglucosamine transferase
MAGGTGGHVFPGLAVADQLSAQGWQIHWLGTAGRMEAQIVPKANYTISFIDVVGVRNNGLIKLLTAPYKIIKAIIQAHKVIRDFKPTVVIGMGGFASGPGGVAAWLNRIPLVVHEQNAVPGLTNKWLSRIANLVLTGFEYSFIEQQNPQANTRFKWVGNPVRAEFFIIPSKTTATLPLNILVVGGSLGAQILNETVPKAVANLSDVAVRHQTGAGHGATVQLAYRNAGMAAKHYQISEFIDDMPSHYGWADVVICRAGALTVAEVAAAGVCGIFVPLPHAVDDHQTKNALSLVKTKAAYLLPQNELTPQRLQGLLLDLQQAPEQLLLMSQQARGLSRMDAAKDVAKLCVELSELSQ